MPPAFTLIRRRLAWHIRQAATAVMRDGIRGVSADATDGNE